MTPQALEILDIIYQLHRQRFRAEKIFAQLPESVRKKYGCTLEETANAVHDAGHELADIVLDLM